MSFKIIIKNRKNSIYYLGEKNNYGNATIARIFNKNGIFYGDFGDSLLWETFYYKKEKKKKWITNNKKEQKLTILIEYDILL